MSEKTEMLRELNGVDASYEGYTYLPHLLFIYAPFYFIYKLVTDGRPPISGGHFEGPFMLIEPNIYVFLVLIKVPIIIADAAITYTLAVKSHRIGLIYAFLPYSITITSIWGAFDPLVGLLLLLTAMNLDKRPLVAGLLFGIAVMKLYVIVTLPAILLYFSKNRRNLVVFLIGLTASQIPTLLFLIQNPETMLNSILFHTSRSPGGVNFLHLAPKLYSYDLQSFVNKLALLTLGIAVSVLALKSGKGFGRYLVPSLAAYMAIGPVTNEQHLSSILPLLFYRGRSLLALWLSYAYLFYALLYSGPAYYTRPISAISEDLNDILLIINQSWYAIFADITSQLLYGLAVICSLTLFHAIKGFVQKVAA
ncbi:MAG: hypothetical protein NZ920_05980 [Aigarchaeota archaeon]|nr:hypothetical protein [Aigarchaeota archaeon]MDW8092655.1 hypothetical protein [Nitrososphaerota archaeon]